jgi:hypothetical protein
MYQEDRDYEVSEWGEGHKAGYDAAMTARLEELSDEEVIKLLEASRRERIVSKLSSHDNYGTEYTDEDGEFQIDFSQPGSGSALRAAHDGNPRILPCPLCHRENMLTPADRARHYVCDGCADARERGGYSYGEY